jgi:hypothetical protein
VPSMCTHDADSAWGRDGALCGVPGDGVPACRRAVADGADGFEANTAAGRGDLPAGSCGDECEGGATVITANAAIPTGVQAFREALSAVLWI